MQLGLQNKVAIVTGAAQGIGLQIAAALHAEGVRLVCADIDAAKLALLPQTPDFAVFTVDVSQEADLQALVAFTLERFDKIDILVNNAGICPRTALEEITPAQWDKVMAVNLRSVFLLSQYVLPHFQSQRWGRIINMASAAGKIGGLQVGAHYAASKAAVICLTKTLALYAAAFNATVNAVCPGVIATEMTTNIGPEKIENYTRRIPLQRLGTAQDVAQTVVFLASEAAAYLTGEITDVNGGFVMD